MRRLLIAAALLCAGCQPYTLGTVNAGPGGATTLRGQAAAQYIADKRHCGGRAIVAGLGAGDRRQEWAACMTERGYNVTAATDQ